MSQALTSLPSSFRAQIMKASTTSHRFGSFEVLEMLLKWVDRGQSASHLVLVGPSTIDERHANTSNKIAKQILRRNYRHIFNLGRKTPQFHTRHTMESIKAIAEVSRQPEVVKSMAADTYYERDPTEQLTSLRDGRPPRCQLLTSSSSPSQESWCAVGSVST